VGDHVQQAGRFVREMLEQIWGLGQVLLLGPAPLGVLRVNNRYRYRIYIHCKANAAIRASISQAVIACCTDKRFRGVSVFAENDPSNM
jgi:primosomal protein N' (replication factor Y)